MASFSNSNVSHAWNLIEYRRKKDRVESSYEVYTV